MNPRISGDTIEPVELSDILGEAEPELTHLLGPSIRLAMGCLPAGRRALVRVRREEIADLLRHLALDARDAMPEGGMVTIRTGRLHGVPRCAALVVHEAAEVCLGDESGRGERIRKGRSLSLGASCDLIEQAGGHLHVSCRGREMVLTICFPLAG